MSDVCLLRSVGVRVHLLCGGPRPKEGRRISERWEKDTHTLLRLKKKIPHHQLRLVGVTAGTLPVVAPVRTNSGDVLELLGAPAVLWGGGWPARTVGQAGEIADEQRPPGSVGILFPGTRRRSCPPVVAALYCRRLPSSSSADAWKNKTRGAPHRIHPVIASPIIASARRPSNPSRQARPWRMHSIRRWLSPQRFTNACR